MSNFREVAVGVVLGIGVGVAVLSVLATLVMMTIYLFQVITGQAACVAPA